MYMSNTCNTEAFLSVVFVEICLKKYCLIKMTYFTTKHIEGIYHDMIEMISEKGEEGLSDVKKVFDSDYEKIIDAYSSDLSKNTSDALQLKEPKEVVEQLMVNYEEKELAKPMFINKIVIGGVVSMMVIVLLASFVPAQPRQQGRATCRPFDKDSLVAHIAESNCSYLITPLIYAIGTGVLGANLFKDASEEKGVFETIKHITEDKKTRTKATKSGMMAAIILMTLGAIDWNSLFGNTDEVPDPVCKEDADKKVPSVGELLTSDVSLLVAVVLNFLGDSFMVSDAFKYKEKRETGSVIKILLDNGILVAALAIRAKQKNASLGGIAGYGAVLAGIYVLCIGLGMVMNRMKIKNIDKFCAGFVPVVLIWTLLLELAPSVLIFQDDSGREISGEMKLSTKTKYKNKKGIDTDVGFQAYIFNQREIIVSIVTIAVFYYFVMKK